MNEFISRITAFLLVQCIFQYATAQQQQVVNLAEMQQKRQLIAYNRTISLADESGNNAVRLSEKDREGLAWLKDFTFSAGTIEIDLKGKDELQKSFLGVAFHGENDSTYDAVYFRPFNFKTTDSVRRIHAVQYISHPVYTWKKLREERNGIFEKTVDPVPDPNQWFHATIEVGKETVKVYVNHSNSPSLTVKKLNNRTEGKIGLWSGDGAGGEFSNLIITKQ